MHTPRPRGPRRANAFRLRDDPGAAGAFAECCVPGAVLGEQSGHLGEAIIVEMETIRREQFTDRVLVLLFVRHDNLPCDVGGRVKCTGSTSTGWRSWSPRWRNSRSVACGI